MLRLILFAVLLLSLINLDAQDEEKVYTVAKLHDGSVYIGKKLSEEDGIIKMKLSSGDTVNFARILGKDILDEQSAILLPNGKYHRTTGRFFSFQFGFHSNFTSEEAAVSTHVEYSYLWRLRPNMSLGPSIGFEFNESQVAGFTFNTTFLSLGVNGRYYINSDKRRIYTFGRIAYGFPGEEEVENAQREHSGGFNFIGGLGVQFPYKKKASFHLNIGQYFQKTSGSEFFLDNLGNEINTEFDIFIKQLVIKVAWDF